MKDEIRDLDSLLQACWKDSTLHQRFMGDPIKTAREMNVKLPRDTDENILRMRCSQMFS